MDREGGINGNPETSPPEALGLIGSMNDAIQLIRFYDELAREEQTEPDLMEMEIRSNRTPYKALRES